MAKLFINQAKQYAENRPSYPSELFRFIASKTPVRDLAWDVGTGSGQAAKSLSDMYKNIVATDTSQTQLQHAPALPNVRYQQTPQSMTLPDLDRLVAPPSSVDLVTVAQALHWFPNPSFYSQVKRVLKKPHGLVAAWCYTTPEFNGPLDSIFESFYAVDSRPYWDGARKMVDDRYETIEFPFEAVEGEEGTGPFRFATEREMGLEDFFGYVRSWSAYQTAKEKGVELLSDEVVGRFRDAWGEADRKIVRFPIYLRMGRVGNEGVC